MMITSGEQFTQQYRQQPSQSAHGTCYKYKESEVLCLSKCPVKDGCLAHTGKVSGIN